MTWSPLAGKQWLAGQTHYVKYDQSCLSHTDDFYVAVDRETLEIYERFPLTGLVLDVVGNFGTVAFQARIPCDRFISVDPMVRLWADLPKACGFAKHYQAIAVHHRVPAFAEDRPIKNNSIDTVHMRSCLDHLTSPHRALLEARRVLKPAGQLVVGLALEGAYKLGASSLKNKVKGLVKRSIIGDVYAHFFDAHIFHPTTESLRHLIEGAGFSIEDWFMQPGYYNVVYLRAVPKA